MQKAANKLYIQPSLVNHYNIKKKLSITLRKPIINHIDENEEYMTNYEYDSDELAEELNCQKYEPKPIIIEPPKISQEEEKKDQDNKSEKSEGQSTVSTTDQSVTNTTRIEDTKQSKSTTKTLGRVYSKPLLTKGAISNKYDSNSLKSLENTKSKASKFRRYRQQVDCNVMSISIGCLQHKTEEKMGMQVYCKQCYAYFNKYSKITVEKLKKVWVCEFCRFTNPINSSKVIAHQSDSVTYNISEKSNDGKLKLGNNQQDSAIVYCIDVSGSMDCSVYDGYRQLTRLGCLKETMKTQIKELNKEKGNTRVGIVKFSTDVKMIWDGQNQEVVIQDQETLWDYQKLLDKMRSIQAPKLGKISDTYSKIESIIDSLKSDAATALLPGMLAAIFMAAQQNIGSQVIVCTDGLSNQGVGNLNYYADTEEYKESLNYYQSIGEIAQSMGVTVHILTIIGSECNINAISKVAEMTGGEVIRVNPANMLNGFKNSIQKPIIASQVQLEILSHEAFGFKNEEAGSYGSNLLLRNFGCVNEETDFTFEFRLRCINQLIYYGIDLSKLKSVPIQIRIAYTSLNGERLIRVDTFYVDITTDKQEIISDCNFELLGLNAVRQSSKYGQLGEFQKSQTIAKAWLEYMIQNAKTPQQVQQTQDYKNMIRGLFYVAKKEIKIIYEKKEKKERQVQSMTDSSSGTYYVMAKVSQKKYQTQSEEYRLKEPLEQVEDEWEIDY